MPLPPLPPGPVRLLKQEPATTVALHGQGWAAVVVKTYRNHGLRRLQTLCRKSRAEREFLSLDAAAATGAPCTAPLGFAAAKGWLGVRSSTLATAYVPDCRTLKAVLAELPGAAFAARRALARALGHLLRTLHGGGFLWGAAKPRNLLVQGDPAAARLFVCDVAAGLPLRRPCLGAPAALVDLYDAAFSPSRRRDWTATDRLRCLLAYCAGDRRQVRYFWGRLGRRPVPCHELHRTLLVLQHRYLFPARRQRQPKAPA